MSDLPRLSPEQEQFLLSQRREDIIKYTARIAVLERKLKEIKVIKPPVEEVFFYVWLEGAIENKLETMKFHLELCLDYVKGKENGRV